MAHLCWASSYKIRLLINPKEEDHRKLVALVQEAISLVVDGKSASQLRMDISALAQVVLKREWERVKNVADES